MRIVLEIAEQRLQVFQVEQQQTFTVSHLERCVESGLLAVSQLEQGTEQQRPHLAERGTQRVTALAMYVPQRHRVGLRLVIEPGHAGDALGDLALRCASSAQATQITFDISGEHRHPGVTEGLDQPLQGHRLAGAGGTGNKTVTVGQAQRLTNRLTITASTQYEL